MCHLRVSPQMFVTVENFNPVYSPLPYTPEWYPCHRDVKARPRGLFPSARAMRITLPTGWRPSGQAPARWSVFP